jgi:hypothetical protein
MWHIKLEDAMSNSMTMSNPKKSPKKEMTDNNKYAYQLGHIQDFQVTNQH